MVTVASFSLVEFLAQHVARERYFQELGSDPDLCPDYAAFRRSSETECRRALRRTFRRAADLALTWRDRLCINGRATEPDALRLAELAGCEVLSSHLEEVATVCSLSGRSHLIRMPLNPVEPREFLLGAMVGYVVAVDAAPELACDPWGSFTCPVLSAVRETRWRVAKHYGSVWVNGGRS